MISLFFSLCKTVTHLQTEHIVFKGSLMNQSASLAISFQNTYSLNQYWINVGKWVQRVARVDIASWQVYSQALRYDASWLAMRQWLLCGPWLHWQGRNLIGCLNAPDTGFSLSDGWVRMDGWVKSNWFGKYSIWIVRWYWLRKGVTKNYNL